MSCNSGMVTRSCSVRRGNGLARSLHELMQAANQSEERLNAIWLMQASGFNQKTGRCGIEARALVHHVRREDSKGDIMKMRITIVALAAVLATPALAQTTQNQPRPYDPSVYSRDQNGNASEYQSRARVRPSTNARNDVYDIQGRYIGSDPDPLVRDQLRRDPTQGVD